jgi:uncharacterized repeat protein (TIGR01451 family)
MISLLGILLLAQPHDRETLPAPAEVRVAPTAGVTLDWAVPSSVRVNKPNDVMLTVRNAAGRPQQKVIVQVRVPEGVTVSDTAPPAKETQGVLVWDLGSFAAADVRDLRMKLTATTKRDLNCEAWVTVTGSAGATVAVREPKLEATLTVPKSVVLGDPIPVTYAVKNVGDATADVPSAKVGTMSDGVMDIQTQVLAQTLSPGDSARGEGKWLTAKGGERTFTMTAEAEGGLTATASATCTVLVPRLTVSVAGPAEKQVGTRSTYTVAVANRGDVPLTDVVVTETFPASFRYLSSSCEEGLATAGSVTWAVGALKPGEVRQFTYEALALTAGPATHLVTAVGSRNTKDEASAKTVVEGIPALRMEVVDRVDPVETNGETTYEIKLTNTGTHADSRLGLVCHIPQGMKFVSASGPTAHREKVGIDFNGPSPVKQNTVTFDAVSELMPKAETVYRVTVKAEVPGDHRFKAVLTSKHLTTPVTKEESTRVYGD